MKFKSLLVFAITLILTGCGNSSTSSSIDTTDSLDGGSVSSSKGEVKEEDQKLFFSELYRATSTLGAAVEISNTNNESIDLSKYKVEIRKKDKLVASINLDSILISNGSYVIGNHINDDNDYHSLCDIILEDNYIHPSNRITIVRNDNGAIVDEMGYKNSISFYDTGSLLKVKEKYSRGGDNYKPEDFLPIKEGLIKYLGNLDYPYKNTDEFLNGPYLSDLYKDLPFQENSLGKGGYVEVTVRKYTDGDTTTFNYPSSAGVDVSSASTRYLYINTPEISHSSDETSQPYGDEASAYTKSVLAQAKHIYVQANINYSLYENYGRFLGFVWYSNETNPTYENIKLLNFEIVKNSLSRYLPSEKNKGLISGDMYYYQYFEYLDYLNSIKGEKVYS